jgi:hypothetical protein
MTVFWDVAPCSLVDIDRRFRGTYCLYHQGDELETGSHVSNQFFARGLLIALMMEAVSTSKTSVNFYQTTRRNNPEDSHLHTRRRESLKSHKNKKYLRLVSSVFYFYVPVYYNNILKKH